MKKGRHHSIDKLFHDSLDGQRIEPSAGVWESLKAYIPATGGSGALFYLLSFVAVGTFSALLIGNVLNGPTGIASTGNSSEIPVTTLSTEAGHQPATEMQDPEKTNYPAEFEVSESTEAGVPVDHEIPVRGGNAAAGRSAVAAHGTSTNDIAGGENLRQYLSLKTTAPCMGFIVSGTTVAASLQTERKTGHPAFRFNMKDDYARKADIVFGAGLSPAINIYPEGQNRNDYSLELLAAYEKSRFIVETGIGANYASEGARYRVNYSSYDSVGFYIGVTSFSILPGNPDSVIFETNLKNIYDSVDHYRITENTNKFVYLQIPLRIGYRIIEGRRFSLDVKAGVLFSLQVYREIPGVPYPGSDADRIEVVRQYPDRLSSNWQYTAGLGMNYHINDRVRFSLEPFYRQYIKSVYSPASLYPARSPYSFGIRGGIYFHF
jgi:hypothetical protein